VAGKATKQTHGVRRRLGAAAARVTGQLQRQDASFPKSNAFLLTDTPGQLRDSISSRARDAAIQEEIGWSWNWRSQGPTSIIT